MGSNYYPFGPHGNRQDPREVPLHPGTTPGSSDPAPSSFGQPAPYVPSGQVYTGYAGGGHPVQIILSFLFVCVLWSVWACLYPLPAIAGGATFFAIDPFFKRVILSYDATAADVAHVAAFIAGMVVLVRLSRFEHRRLAPFRAYRIVRHFIRLPLFAFITIRWFIQDEHFLPRPGQKWIDFERLSRPENLAVVVGVMVAMSFILWKGDRLREFWHRRLEDIGMRPS